jgi:hypothetical protein
MEWLKRLSGQTVGLDTGHLSADLFNGSASTVLSCGRNLFRQ